MPSLRTHYPTPNHLVSTTEKMKSTWYKNTCNYYINLATNFKDTDALNRDIRAFSGQIDKKDYHFILNPYNFKEERFKNLPGRLRNYDIISPIWRRYMGEYSKSNNLFGVISVNDHIETQMEFGLMQLVNERLTQLAANSLNAAGIESGIESRSVPNLSDDVKTFKANWKQTRAELGQERLNVLRYSVDDESIRNRAYSDWINYGEFYTFRDLHHNDVYKEAVPVDEYYPISNGRDNVEDHDAGVRIRFMTIPQVLEVFGSKLTKDEYKYLTELSNTFAEGYTTIKGSIIYDKTNIEAELAMKDSFSETADYRFCDTQGYLEVAHVPYKTMVEVKVLTYENELGEVLEVEVNKNYKLDEASGDIKTEIVYRTRVWEQYRLGDEITGLYLKPSEIPVQRTDINNENICKLPYNGRVRMFPGFPNHGIINTLLPYQIFINILYLSRERAIARNHGKILIVPRSFVRGDGDLTDNEIIYYATADGKLYVDDTSPTFSVGVQGMKSVDTGDSEYILGLGRLIEETKNAAREDVDMNRQRVGETLASDGKFTTQQAIIRSSLGSAIINDLFNKTLEKDYDADLDYSKIAWIDGKKGHYVNSDRQVAYYDINGIEHAETSYGTFTISNSKEQDKINNLRDLAFSAAQNGDFVIASESIMADSSTRLNQIIRDYQDIAEKRRENAEKEARESQERIAQSNAATEKEKLTSEERIAQYDGSIKIKLKEIDVLIARLKIAGDAEKADIDNQIKEKQLELQRYIADNKLAVDQAQSNLGLV
jgi:hypothetical protein